MVDFFRGMVPHWTLAIVPVCSSFVPSRIHAALAFLKTHGKEVRQHDSTPQCVHVLSEGCNCP